MLSAEETDSFLELRSVDTLLPDVPWKLFAVITLLAEEDSDPLRGLPDAAFTPTPAAAVPAFSTAAAASSHPPPADEETGPPKPSPRFLVVLLCILLSAQSPLTRRVPLLAVLVKRRPRSACSKGLPVSGVSTLGDLEPGEADGGRVGGGEGGGLFRAEAALDLASDPRALLTPKRSPVTAGARDVAVEPRTVASLAGLWSSTLAKGFDDDEGADV